MFTDRTRRHRTRRQLIGGLFEEGTNRRAGIGLEKAFGCKHAPALILRIAGDGDCGG